MTHLSADVVQEIASYLDMSTLRKMIDLSEEMKSTVGDVFSLEFYRRGEKFVNWVNSLRVVREVTDVKITDTTYISENVRIVQSSLLSSCGYSLSRIVMLDGVEMKSIRLWNDEGAKIFSGNYKDGLRHGLREQWNARGVKRLSYNYKNGLRHGLCENWNAQGVKRSSYNYKDGQGNGLCEDWDDQGEKVYSNILLSY